MIKIKSNAIIFFDGVCNLCCGLVAFVIRRDPRGRFRFAALQSDFARETLRRAGADPGSVSTLALLEGDRLYLRSAAALRIARGLRWPWPLLAVLAAVPRPFRDALYDAIARRRYGWWGRRESCLVPRPEVKNRFV